MIDRIIGVVGIALALIFGMANLAPEGWPKVPTWASYLGVAVGVLLVGIAIGFAVADYWREPKRADSAELQLHIYPDQRTPTRLSYSNIWRWYYMKLVLIGIDKSTGLKQQQNVTSTLFLTFDTPVRVGTLEVSSPDIRLPMHEVKDFNDRSAIVFFNDDLAEGTLVIKVHQ